jgi:hypothetical protein
MLPCFERMKGTLIMVNRRAIQWLIPLLYGVGLGITICWNVEIWLPDRDAVSKYVSLLGIAALLIATLLKSRTGYNWPWEGPAEWAEARETSMKAHLRNLVLWVVIVLLLLALFTLWQFPGFR